MCDIKYLNTKAVMKRTESFSLKRVGGWCEPMAGGLEGLWLLS